MMNFNVGIIGLGMIGGAMLAEFEQHPSFTVAAAYDLNPAVSGEMAGRYPHLKMAVDAAAIINDPDIQLIYIATPPVTHVDYGLQVSAAGKGLLCEKPLAIDLAQGQLLLDRANQAGIPTAMNFVYGAGSLVAALEEQVGGGALGEVTSIEVRYQFPSWPLPNQLSAAAWIIRRHEGGMLREMFSHFVYLLQRLFGEVTLNTATIQYPPDASLAEEFVIASLQAGGIPVWLMGGIGSQAAPRESELTIHGTEASLRLSSLAALARAENGSWQELPLEASGRHDAQARLDALALRMAGKETSLPGLREGYEVQKVIENMLATATRNQAP